MNQVKITDLNCGVCRMGDKPTKVEVNGIEMGELTDIFLRAGVDNVPELTLGMFAKQVDVDIKNCLVKMFVTTLEGKKFQIIGDIREFTDYSAEESA